MENEELQVELVASKKENKPLPEGQLTVDVYQTSDDIVIRSTIAGVSRDSIDISLTKDMITIKGRREPDEKIKSQDYYYQELYWGVFSRSVILPVDIDPENAKATLNNGLLTIRLPKLEKSQIKKVKIS